MPHRMDIELTSERDDGSWTWRAAGARQPRGVVVADLLPDAPSVGDQFKVEVESDVDGISILSIVTAPPRGERTDLIELLPIETDFKPVIEQRAPRGGRGDDRGGPRRDRRDGDRPGGDRRGGDRRAGDRRGGDRPERGSPDR
ncbi:MAG: hypothetical protein M3Q72_05100, partial [Actinomycetota bacterium]|nr:hypothetical protein [Actinomycetota bacterium]